MRAKGITPFQTATNVWGSITWLRFTKLEKKNKKKHQNKDKRAGTCKKKKEHVLFREKQNQTHKNKKQNAPKDSVPQKLGEAGLRRGKKRQNKKSTHMVTKPTLICGNVFSMPQLKHKPKKVHTKKTKFLFSNFGDKILVHNTSSRKALTYSTLWTGM